MERKGLMRGLKKTLVTALAVTMFATSLPTVPAYATEGTESTFYEDTQAVEITDADADVVLSDIESEEKETNGEILLEDESENVDSAVVENVQQESVVDEAIESDDEADVTETVDSASELENEEETLETEEVNEEASMEATGRHHFIIKPGNVPEGFDKSNLSAGVAVADPLYSGIHIDDSLGGDLSVGELYTDEDSLGVWVFADFTTDTYRYNYYTVIKDNKGNEVKYGRKRLEYTLEWSETDEIVFTYDVIPMEKVSISIDYKDGKGVKYTSGNNLGKLKGLWNGSYIRGSRWLEGTYDVAPDENCNQTKTAAVFSNYNVSPYSYIYLTSDGEVRYSIKSISVTKDGVSIDAPPYRTVPAGLVRIDISDFASGNYKILVELEPVTINKFVIEKGSVPEGAVEAPNDIYNIDLLAENAFNTYFDKERDAYILETYDEQADILVHFNSNDAENLITKVFDAKGEEVESSDTPALIINASWNESTGNEIVYTRKAYYEGLVYKPFSVTCDEQIKSVKVGNATKNSEGKYVPDEGAAVLTFEVTTNGKYEPTFKIGAFNYSVGNLELNKKVKMGANAESTSITYIANIPVAKLSNGVEQDLKTVTITGTERNGNTFEIYDIPTNAQLTVKDSKGNVVFSKNNSEGEYVYYGVYSTQFTLDKGIGEKYTITVNDTTVTGFEMRSGANDKTATGKTFTYVDTGIDAVLHVKSKQPLQIEYCAGGGSLQTYTAKTANINVFPDFSEEVCVNFLVGGDSACLKYKLMFGTKVIEQDTSNSVILFGDICGYKCADCMSSWDCKCNDEGHICAEDCRCRKCTWEKYEGKTLTLRVLSLSGDTYAYNFKFASRLSWVKLNGKTNVAQSLGKTVSYKLTSNNGYEVDTSKISFSYTDEEGQNTTCGFGETYSKLGIECDYSDNVISLRQCVHADGKYVEDLDIIFKDANDYSASVKVLFNNDFLGKAVATAKLVSASDIALNLELSTNGITSSDDRDGRLFYRVVYEQISGDKLLAGVRYIPVDTGKAEQYTLYIMGTGKADEGNGRAEDFKLSTSLVVGYNDGDSFVTLGSSGKTSVLNKVSTKKPSYATSFSLKAIKAKINTSDGGKILVAKGVFDKNASYLNLSNASVVGCPTGVTLSSAAEVLAPSVDGDSVYLNLDRNEPLSAGVYTLEVYSQKNDLAKMKAASAKIKITVVQDVELSQIKVSLSSDTIAKKAKGNATLKTLVTYPVIGGKTYKPAKIIYKITGGSDYAQAAIANKQVTINEKTGVVSVSSDYVVSSNADYNIFSVFASTTNKGGYSQLFMAGIFKIKANANVIAGVKLKTTDDDYIDLTDAVTTDVICGSEIVAVNQNGDEIDPNSVTFTVTGATVNYLPGILRQPYIKSAKVGTVTITAKSEDGGNSIAKLTFKTKYASTTAMKFYLENCEDDEWCEVNDKEDFSDYYYSMGYVKLLAYLQGGDEDSCDILGNNTPLTNLAISVTGGSLVKTKAGDRYLLTINKDKAVVNVKDKTNNQTYTFTVINSYAGFKGKVKSLKPISKIYSTEGIEETDGLLQEVWIKPNTKLDSNYELLVDYMIGDNIFCTDYCMYDESQGAFCTVFKGAIPKGNIKCMGYITEDSETVDGPIAFTLSAAETPTYSVADITVKTKQSAYGKITNVIPKTTNCTVVGIDDRENAVPYQNAVVNGRANKATYYWNVEYDENTKSLYVVFKDPNPIRDISKDNLIEYVTLKVKDSFGKYRYVQVKVTLSPSIVKECTGEHTWDSETGMRCEKCGYYYEYEHEHEWGRKPSQYISNFWADENGGVHANFAETCAVCGKCNGEYECLIESLYGKKWNCNGHDGHNVHLSDEIDYMYPNEAGLWEVYFEIHCDTCNESGSDLIVGT